MPDAKTNRLANETSPYLLQHAHNPVGWYAWGPEAFAEARKQDKPIFLSVGYSTCYWCHVMERQSFEVEDVARQMNEQFINIKVDREERPDVDQLYMTAVQLLTQQGGWPMSVWLTPELKPYYAGTYFPPEDAHGRPGFKSICTTLANAYRNRRDEVEKSAARLTRALGQIQRLAHPPKPLTLDIAWVERLVDRSVADYDARNGGFGTAPKFPQQTQLELLLRWLDSHPTDLKKASRVKQMLTHTLDAMAAGGIRDQLGGGFHRYSTDARWLVPHFEIMLYDNAMLGWVYAEAFRQFGDARYAMVARGIFDFVLREMTSPEGAFYTAFDAEVDAREGLSYLWKLTEVEQVLGQADAEKFAQAYGLDAGPNFADPHHSDGGPDQSVLHIADANFAEQHEAELAPMREKLLAVRKARKQPLLDTKVLTAWNAMMIRGLAHGGAALGESRYTDAAKKAGEFLLREHRAADGGIIRTSRNGVKKHAGTLDDYAFFALALQALGDARAGEIITAMIDRFDDVDRGGFFFTDRSADDLIVRQKVATDSPLPSGNAAAAGALLAAGRADIARQTIIAFAQQAESHGESMSAFVQDVLAFVQEHGHIEVPAGEPEPAEPQSPEEIAAGVVNVGAQWVARSTLRLVLAIRPGFHLNANPADAGLVATEVVIAGSAVQKITYPPGVSKSFPFTDQPISVYEGQTPVDVQFVDEPSGRLNIGLVYQACTDNACLPPVRKTAIIDVG